MSAAPQRGSAVTGVSVPCVCHRSTPLPHRHAHVRGHALKDNLYIQLITFLPRLAPAGAHMISREHR